jgi:hypothetical protein
VVLEREDGPAKEWASGTKKWYLNGEMHREDGPAVEWASGTKCWYLNGKEVTEEEHKRMTSKRNSIGKRMTSKVVECWYDCISD